MTSSERIQIVLVILTILVLMTYMVGYVNATPLTRTTDSDQSIKNILKFASRFVKIAPVPTDQIVRTVDLGKKVFAAAVDANGVDKLPSETLKYGVHTVANAGLSQAGVIGELLCEPVHNIIDEVLNGSQKTNTTEAYHVEQHQEMDNSTSTLITRKM